MCCIHLARKDRPVETMCCIHLARKDRPVETVCCIHLARKDRPVETACCIHLARKDRPVESVLCTTFVMKEQMPGIPSTGNKHSTAYFGKKEWLEVISSRTAQCIAYLGQVNEDLHALVWPHVCDVAEVGGGRDDPRHPVTPTQHSRTVK